MDELIAYNAYVWNIFGSWIRRKIMQKVRANCFWHQAWQDLGSSAIIHQCYLGETGECPCTADCEWFIDTLGARALIYEKQMEDKERRDAQMPFGF